MGCSQIHEHIVEPKSIIVATMFTGFHKFSQVIMLYDIYFIKHYYFFFKENNFLIMSQNRHTSTTDQLQRVLNSAGRLLLWVPKSDWELRTKVRDRLQWLRAPERVSYKLCTLVYKALHNKAPSYLPELCVPILSDAYRSHLRSADRKELKFPRHNLSTYGPRSFSIAGPTVWNSLPVHLRDEKLSYEQFSSGLKSFLFRISYDL